MRYTGLPAPEVLYLALKDERLPVVKEYRFDTKRLWRIDCAFPDIKLAVEVEGGVHSGGRHTRGTGFLKDMEKYNSLTEQGWHLLRYDTETVADLKCLPQIKRVYLKLKSGGFIV